MDIPPCYCTEEYIARLTARAESILRSLGVANLLRVEGSQAIRGELRKAAEEVVGAMRLRLLKSQASPPREAAWDVFFYQALRNDALHYRGKLLREKRWPSLTRIAERYGREEGDVNRRSRREAEPGSTPFHLTIAAEVIAAIEPAVQSLIEDGFITAGEKADDFLRVVLAYLQDPEEGFDSHRQAIVGGKPDGLSKATANTWWREIRSYLAYRFGPALRPARGAK